MTKIYYVKYAVCTTDKTLFGFSAIFVSTGFMASAWRLRLTWPILSMNTSVRFVG
jgi:hypothetical protein